MSSGQEATLVKRLSTIDPAIRSPRCQAKLPASLAIPAPFATTAREILP